LKISLVILWALINILRTLEYEELNTSGILNTLKIQGYFLKETLKNK
jgi:hypothetical protein